MAAARNSPRTSKPAADAGAEKRLPPLPINPDGALRLLMRELPWPMPPRAPWQTDAQYEAGLCVQREHRWNMSVWDGVMRLAMSRHGCPLHCPLKTCRRAGACVGIRPPEPEEHAFYFLPPCQPVDKETLIFWRDEAKTILLEFLGRKPPETPGRDAAGR